MVNMLFGARLVTQNCYLSRVLTVYSFAHHALGAVVDHVRLMCLSGYIQTSFSICIFVFDLLQNGGIDARKGLARTVLYEQI